MGQFKRAFVFIIAVVVSLVFVATPSFADESSRVLVENSWRFQDGQSITPEEDSEDAGISAYSLSRLPDGVTAQGIDVSEHQGNINWDAVKASGIDFAILRVGFGAPSFGGRADYQFQRNISECERLGIPYGIYLYSYAWDDGQAADEAAFVINNIAGHGPQLPIYYDLEDNSIIADGRQGGIASRASVFCNRILNAGYKVGIYANLNWFNNILTDPVFNSPSWDHWIAQYNYQCDYAGKYSFWQYASDGSVDGISGSVDMNYAYGATGVMSDQDKAAWEINSFYEAHSAQLGNKDGGIVHEGTYSYLKCELGRVYWTKKSGAHSICGLFFQKWCDLGMESSDLGLPVGDETSNSSNGSGSAQDFQNGSLHWTNEYGFVSVRSGAIRSEYVRRGWQAGPLGWPVAEAEALPGGGSQQRFQNGTIVTSSKGTFEMDGEMLDLWTSLGGVDGLGYPLSNAAWFPQNGGGYSTDFERGSIAWTSSHHAVSVRSGAIRSEYVRRGWQAGPLGWPVAEAEALPGGGSQQRFQNGVLRDLGCQTGSSPSLTYMLGISQ